MRDRKHFIIPGAQRSGTSLLYHILDTHPEITMAKPLKPEPRFFLKGQEYQSGYDFYLDKYFQHQDTYKWYGEKSTSYMEYGYVASKIKTLLPKAQLIFILRNPVFRAISNYFFSIKNGLETRSLKQAFIDEIPPPKLSLDISVNPFDYEKRGYYSDFIRPYFEAFHPERIKILIFEKLVSDQYEELSSLFDFLGLDLVEDSRSVINKQVNASGPVDYDANDMIRVVEKLKGKYKHSINQLEDYLGIDLSIWKRNDVFITKTD